jgi:creatinine amidohydrolase
MHNATLGEMTVEEVRTFLRDGNRTIILPYGVVEQHGYHLPLDTDIRNATVIGTKLAEALHCLVAPTLNYCFSGGMLPGTINVRPNTFSNLVCEIVESLAAQGFENVLVLPGHGGSESLRNLEESLRVLKWVNPLMRDRLVMLVRMWELSPTWLHQIEGRDYHAGTVETSLLMSWTPAAVRPNPVLDAPEVAEGLRRDPDSYQVFERFTDLPQEIPTTRQDARIAVGVMGYPERACAELGAKITDEILEHAVPALRGALEQAARKRNA